MGPLRRSCEPSKIRTGMPGDVLLICGECHCASDEHAKGWAAFTGEDPDRHRANQRRNPVRSARPASSSGDPKQQRATSESGFPSSRELRQAVAPPKHSLGASCDTPHVVLRITVGLSDRRPLAGVRRRQRGVCPRTSGPRLAPARDHAHTRGDATDRAPLRGDGRPRLGHNGRRGAGHRGRRPPTEAGGDSAVFRDGTPARMPRLPGRRPTSRRRQTRSRFDASVSTSARRPRSRSPGSSGPN